MPARTLRAFDTALVGHIGFAIGNALCALWLGLTGSHFVSVPASIKCCAGNETLLSATYALFGGIRFSFRCLHAGAGRRLEVPRKTLGAAGRHFVADVSHVSHAQALSGRRLPGSRCAADALGNLGCDVPCAIGV